MNSEIKSGKEITAGFFAGIEDIPGVDRGIADLLKDLYNKDKLTQKSLSNALLRLRMREAKKK